MITRSDARFWYEWRENAAARTVVHSYVGRMPAYEQLDAFRVCHELALRVYRTAEQIDKRDPELAVQLWSAALIASARIARGVGFRNRRMFAMCLDRTLAALAEVGYHLNVARTLDLLTEGTQQDLESLRGRAVFYTTKLLTTLWDQTREDGPRS